METPRKDRAPGGGPHEPSDPPTPQRRRVSMSRKTAALLIAGYVVVIAAALVLGSADAATTSIADQLTSSKAAIEVTSEPTGTTTIHVAVMQNMQAAGLKYLDRPASETTITPPAGYPVIDVQAKGSSGAIGGWAGRLATVPGLTIIHI